MASLAIIQARMGSTRLPGKVLMPLISKPVLWHVINQVRKARHVDTLIVATTTCPEDDTIEARCREWGVLCFRGDPLDVLKRFHDTVRSPLNDHRVFDYVIRITADCPLIDPDIIDRIVREARKGGYDYVSNTDPPTFPDGLDVEVFTPKSLETAHLSATLMSDREHVTPFIRRDPQNRKMNVSCEEDLSYLRWTLDTREDYAFLTGVYDNLLGEEGTFSYRDVLSIIEKKPELLSINNMFHRNEGYEKSLLEDKKKTGS
ncbi:MAG: glycosyltransferase family protein [Methanoregula sp.]|nr:glycosyltransferase family protein [Methanoregula sp.]